MSHILPETHSVVIGESVRRKVSRHILPFVWLLYLIAYVDRSNVGYASLKMTNDLHFSPDVFGFGSGVFFAGYFLPDIPVCVVVQKWGARKIIACMMVCWGVVAACGGFVTTAHQFYVLRFSLGLAEGGFFPGVIIYLSQWFRYWDRGRALAWFLTAIPVSQVVCGPISAALLNVHWLGLSGWRWMLLLEGVPAILLGCLAWHKLTDTPSDARWLPGPEREWLVAQLDRTFAWPGSTTREKAAGSRRTR